MPHIGLDRMPAPRMAIYAVQFRKFLHWIHQSTVDNRTFFQMDYSVLFLVPVYGTSSVVGAHHHVHL